jgi:hypothetical protein
MKGRVEREGGGVASHNDLRKGANERRERGGENALDSSRRPTVPAPHSINESAHESQGHAETSSSNVDRSETAKAARTMSKRWRRHGDASKKKCEFRSVQSCEGGFVIEGVIMRRLLNLPLR